MKLSRPPLGLLTLVLLGVLAVGGAYLRLAKTGPRGSAAAPGAGGAAAPGAGSETPPAVREQFPTDVAQPVVGAEVIRDTLWVTVTAAGQAASVQGAPLHAEVGGRIRRILVRENSAVGSGDLLVEMDTTEYALALARARAELLRAQAAFQEMTLFDHEIPDPQVREERSRLARARSGLAQAEVVLRQAELDLERTTVRAPFAGRVANLRVVEGQRVGAGAELLTVVALDPIRVEAKVLEGELGALAEGRRGRVRFAALAGETFAGRVVSINPVVDADRTARVTLEVANPQGRIKPGMWAQVTLEARGYPDRILVPRGAILEKDRRTMLFVYEEGRAKWRYVTTGLENDRFVEIVEHPETDGVRPGEIVLVENHHYLVHDAPVRLVERAPTGVRGREPGEGGGP